MQRTILQQLSLIPRYFCLFVSFFLQHVREASAARDRRRRRQRQALALQTPP